MYSQEIIVTIKRFKEFNYRPDVKASTWFRFEHKFFSDSQFFDFSLSERCAWIYILCEASQNNKATVTINIAHLEKIGGIKLKDFDSALFKLQRNGTIDTNLQERRVEVTPTLRGRNEHDTGTGATDERTNERTITPISGLRQTENFDFESVYAAFPKQVGKKKGISRLKAQIRTQEDFVAVTLACANYVAYCQRQKLEHRFIKHFSSWTSEWEDWIDKSHGNGHDFSNGASSKISIKWNDRP